MPENTSNSVHNVPIRIGISTCLLGEHVRYDGGHKKNSYICQTLGQYFEYTPLCPEVGIGMSIPREPIRLIDIEGESRAQSISGSHEDFTESLDAFAGKHRQTLASLSGYLLKSGSPSCGMERVKRYKSHGKGAAATKDGVGIFAAALMRHFPLMPVEEEGRLADPGIRENFIERVFVYVRWQQLLQQGLTPQALVEFHTQHKYLLMLHSQPAYQSAGQMIAKAGTADINALADAYIDCVMQALKIRASAKQHANVMYHLLGYLKNELDSDDKEEMVDTIERYRTGLLPLIVPVTLLHHFFRKYPNRYVAKQWYLSPHPAELMLRNTL